MQIRYAKVAGLTLMWAAALRAQTTPPPFVEIGEVVTGLYAAPRAQYVVLRVVVGGDLTGWGLHGWDNANPPAGMSFAPLQGDLTNVPSGSTYLLANAAAAAFFHITPDAPLAGISSNGLLTLADVQGREMASFPYGGATDPHFAIVHPFNPAGGIPLGAVAQLYHDSTTATENNAATDYFFTPQPWPQNSAGQVGTPTPGMCGNGIIEALEQCDDASQNGTPSDTCSSQCLLKPNQPGTACGNFVVEAGEQCDDGNLINGDGCSATCQWENLHGEPVPQCGNHVLEVDEQCDPPGGPCSADCLLDAAASCGDGSVEAGEQCDDGNANGAATDPCTADCLWNTQHPIAMCGNAVVEAGEQCDSGSQNDPQGADLGDPNIYHSGCSYLCQFETIIYYRCGDGRLNPGEACDDGVQNGVAGDACTARCTWVNPAYNTTTPGSGVGIAAGGTIIISGTTSGGGSAVGGATGGWMTSGSSPSADSGGVLPADAPSTSGSSAGAPTSASHPPSCVTTGASWPVVMLCLAATLLRRRRAS